MAGACRKRRRHGRGALCVALLAGSGSIGVEPTRLEWPACCAVLWIQRQRRQEGCTVADRAFCMSLYARSLRLNPAGRHRQRQSETSRRAASRTDGSQMCVNAVQRRQSAKTFLLRDTSTVHLQRWRQMDEFATAPLCVLKVATNKRTNLQTVCINFWTSKQS